MSPPVEPIFRRRRDRRGWRVAAAALLALLVHGGFALLVMLFVMLGWMNLPLEVTHPTEAVSLMNLSATEWAQNRQVGPQPQQKTAPHPALEPKKPDEEQKPEELPKGQVVDVAPGNDEKPEDSKFLAEHNNKVQKQTQSKDKTPFYKNAQAKRTTTLPPTQAVGHDVASKPSLAGNLGTGQDEAPKQAGAASGHFDVPSVEKRDQVAVMERGPNGDIRNQSETAAVKGNSDRLNITPGPKAEGEAQPESQGRMGDHNVANLLPSAATLDKISGAAANDHLDDVENGEGTYLNTREFKYATFFNRVKQSVGEHWDPGAPLRVRDPEGKIYAYKDRYTMLNVTLDTSGRLKAVSVEKSSGVEFLDDEAVAAFERAQPFPNPPPGLVDHNEVRFSFGFFLEVNSGSSLHIFRSRD